MTRDQILKEMTDTLILELKELARQLNLDGFHKQANLIGNAIAIINKPSEISVDALTQNVLNGIDMALHHLQADAALSRTMLCDALNSAKNVLLREPKRESCWVSTKDRLPAKPGKASYEHVDCLVVYKGEVEQLMWNCEHLVWDDRSGDDFYCNPGDVDYWMPTPNPPEIEDGGASE